MKICVIAGRYALSGVPLAQIRFARALVNLGHEVEIIFGLVNPGFEEPEVNGIKVLVLNKSRVTGMLWPLLNYFKQKDPEIIFTAGDHLNVIVLIAALISRSKAKISCSSRVTPFDTYSGIPFTKRWILKILMRIVMPRADVLTCVSEDMVTQYQQVFGTTKHLCVYNIVVDSYSKDKLNEYVDDEWLIQKEKPIIIAAGNLVPWKGFSDLIMAMAELSKTKKTKLIILGDGPLRGELQELIVRLGLENEIKLMGYVSNPLKYFSKADIFVLSSHVEGLPNVLVEAMMCGCTPVSTNCPTGPREVLKDGKYGYLVPVSDPIALAHAIQKAIVSPISEKKLNEAIKPFVENVVIERHFELLGIEK